MQYACSKLLQSSLEKERHREKERERERDSHEKASLLVNNSRNERGSGGDGAHIGASIEGIALSLKCEPQYTLLTQNSLLIACPYFWP